MIVVSFIPDILAFEEAAALQECVWKTLIFIPLLLSALLHHLEIVSFATLLCGLIWLINSFEVFRKGFCQF